MPIDLIERLDRLVTANKAAEITRYKPQTLAVWRYTGKNLPFVRSGRSIRCRVSDIERFIATGNAVANGSTSAVAPAGV